MKERYHINLVGTTTSVGKGKKGAKAIKGGRKQAASGRPSIPSKGGKK